MKQLSVIALLSLIFFPSLAFPQESQPVAQTRQQANQQLQEINLRTREIELAEREIELQQKQAEIDFQREKQNIELERQRLGLKSVDKTQKDNLAPLLLLLLIVHILCAVWVYQDIRKLNNGSGIWIVIALISGLFGTLVYAVIRIGQTPKTTT